MNNQTEQQSNQTTPEAGYDDSKRVNIQPSETETDTEENAPGRTAGKAEGSSEIVESDLADKDQ